MDITTFDDLLGAARAQPDPQRLLFVFAGAELPDDATPEQRAGFASGEGGALTPLMSADKMPGELASFAALVEESRQFGRNWVILFAASLPGTNGRAPSARDAERPLQQMVERIQAGDFGTCIPFDRQGTAVMLAAG